MNFVAWVQTLFSPNLPSHKRLPSTLKNLSVFLFHFFVYYHSIFVIFYSRTLKYYRFHKTFFFPFDRLDFWATPPATAKHFLNKSIFDIKKSWTFARLKVSAIICHLAELPKKRFEVSTTTSFVILLWNFPCQKAISNSHLSLASLAHRRRGSPSYDKFQASGWRQWPFIWLFPWFWLITDFQLSGNYLTPKWFVLYETLRRHLNTYRNRSLNVLEIGNVKQR